MLVCAEGENPANDKTEQQQKSNHLKLTMKVIPVNLMIIYIHLKTVHTVAERKHPKQRLQLLVIRLQVLLTRVQV